MSLTEDLDKLHWRVIRPLWVVGIVLLLTVALMSGLDHDKAAGFFCLLGVIFAASWGILAAIRVIVTGFDEPPSHPGETP